jgi:hypothetical protein
MRLTRGKLLKQPDWDEWQASEYLQLDQYDAQGMFGQPVPRSKDMSVFHSVWTYAIKALDARKKARWACDGSPRSGQAKILDETYANCVDQTSSRLFYAISAAENLLIYGADVSNAFAEAPPPNRDFLYTLTGHSGNGGATTRNGLQLPTGMLSLSYPQCRAIRNPPGYGRNMPTPSCVSVASRLQSMNHVFTQAWSMVSE